MNVLNETLVKLVNGEVVTKSMIKEIQRDFNLVDNEVESLVVGFKVSKEDLKPILFEVCDYVHASCNSCCPVYAMGGLKDGDCDHHKDSDSMYEFIKHGVIAMEEAS